MTTHRPAHLAPQMQAEAVPVAGGIKVDALIEAQKEASEANGKGSVAAGGAAKVPIAQPDPSAVVMKEHRLEAKGHKAQWQPAASVRGLLKQARLPKEVVLPDQRGLQGLALALPGVPVGGRGLHLTQNLHYPIPS